jgi:hypothetical protein
MLKLGSLKPRRIIIFSAAVTRRPHIHTEFTAVKARAIALLLILSMIQPVFAWNDCGHMAIAAMAYAKLSPPAKQRIAVLLQKNPDYAAWVHDAKPGQRELFAFMRAAIWADAIKHNADYADTPEHSASISATDFSYSDKAQHRPWHYINNPFSPDRIPLQAAATPNIQTQIAALRRALQARQSTIDTQSYSLVWLVHLVGDAHQPLHTTSRFTHAFPYGDKGGNAITLCEQICDSNLHAFWDNALGTSGDAENVLRAIAQFPRASGPQADIIDENIWLLESAAIAQRVAYAPPIDSGAQNITLTPAYKTTAYEVARQRAAVAGARLANLLNALLAD